MIQQTSLDAFREISPKLGQQEQLVYDCIKEHGPVCDRDISYLTGIEKSSVCGRRNKLYNNGIVTVGHEDIDPVTGKRVILWVLSGKIVRKE